MYYGMIDLSLDLQALRSKVAAAPRAARLHGGGGTGSMQLPLSAARS
eukprot:SAG22_NODE_219_length_14877_cov_14.334619_13_plen_47_part_00